MAQHIASIRTSGIRQVAKDEFYKELVWGDLVFCQGNYTVSKGIEAVTGSPLSHVLMVWLPAGATEWLTLEATIDRGVHIGRLGDYVDSYDGDLILCRRQLSDAQKLTGLNYGFSLLDDKYDSRQEAKMVAHKILPLFPVSASKGEFFCSGLQYAISLAQGVPLKTAAMKGALPSPEENYTDPTVVPVCALVK